MRWALKNDFKQLDPSKTRIVLVDRGEQVLRAMPEALSEAAMRSLAADGVECISSGRVQTMRPRKVIVGTPEDYIRLQAATVISASCWPRSRHARWIEQGASSSTTISQYPVTPKPVLPRISTDTAI